MVPKKKSTFLLILLALCVAVAPTQVRAQAQSAILFVETQGGSFDVGNTFSVSINVDTGGSAINAIEANLIFPPDKIQVVSPSTGTSFIDVWVGQPKFSNEQGTISFQGAIPSPGANTSKGLISTVTFRVKSTGSAFLRFSDDSKVLLNDGHATNILSDMRGAVFELTLPPPQGPHVTSVTHPKQDVWYADASAVLDWSDGSSADAYSYILDQNPVTIPDNVAENDGTQVVYDSLANGRHYFHIRALKGGVWGGTTHFAINVDTLPPADFELEVEPRKQTVQTRPVITFSTTDAHAGLDHYEIKIVPRYVQESGQEVVSGQSFFVEADSPYITELQPGKYDVIVRAYDRVGNFLEKTEQIRILPSFFGVVEWMLPALVIIIPVLLCLLALSIYFAIRMRYWHAQVASRVHRGALSDDSVKDKLEKLKEYQKRYGSLTMFLLLVGLSWVFATHAVHAQTVDTPLITTYSADLTNQERFYIGGRHNLSESQITIFLQRKETGETFSVSAETDQRGDWFYITDEPLQAGKYIIWSQANKGSLSSAPSAQIEVTSIPVVLRTGSSLLTKETIYLGIVCVLLGLLLAAVLYGLFHRRAGKKKQEVLERQIFEAQQSIKIGFAMLRNDMKAQLEATTKDHMSSEVREEEEHMERKILEDLAYIEENIKKEVADLEQEL